MRENSRLLAEIAYVGYSHRTHLAFGAGGDGFVGHLGAGSAFG